ncbi:MAG: DUF473 family protein [Candidatus Methanohalarchaeum thermophilum]|uniref:DUF473 family protein n=1 Tax=Methanohalarchaeum thermophilum TaxID=1903181 RepID=A0A1Q6DTC7_METT1|nr:MAG: DUF473 family protein [Candidatus Methanohalarchaeum thermophilum]
MEMKVLTGIAKPVLDELMESGTRTIEFRSAHNINSIIDISIEEKVFLTNKKKDDICKGTNGIIIDVQKKNISMHHVSYSSNSIYEEHETTIARLKTKLKGLGTVKNVKKSERKEGIIAEIEERVESYSAR